MQAHTQAYAAVDAPPSTDDDLADYLIREIGVLTARPVESRYSVDQVVHFLEVAAAALRHAQTDPDGDTCGGDKALERARRALVALGIPSFGLDALDGRLRDFHVTDDNRWNMLLDVEKAATPSALEVSRLRSEDWRRKMISRGLDPDEDDIPF